MPITPVFVEKMTGDQAAPQVEEQFGGISKDARLNEYIDFVGRRMLPYSLRGNEPHKFILLNDDKTINAFALGNGNIYVTKGLLKMLGDEAELAEVLGHENGHFGHRHIASQMDRGIGLGLMLALAEGFYAQGKGGRLSDDQGEAIQKANELAMGLVLNGFGREQELESDAHGLETMVKAGYDPMGAVSTFQKFQRLEKETSGLEAFLQSHPTAKQRVADLTDAIARKYPNVEGRRYVDRYNRIVNGTESLSQVGEGNDGGSSEILGIPTPIAIAGGLGLAITAGIVIASL